MIIEKELDNLIDFIKNHSNLSYIDSKQYCQSIKNINLYFCGVKRRAIRLDFQFSKYCGYSFVYVDRLPADFLWKFRIIIERTSRQLINMNYSEELSIGDLRITKDILKCNCSFTLKDFLINYKPFWNMYKKFNFQEILMNLKLELL